MRAASEGMACIFAGNRIVRGPPPGLPQVISKWNFRISVAWCEARAGEATALADWVSPAAAGPASAAAATQAAAARFTR
jgi:hypothetical protein